MAKFNTNTAELFADYPKLNNDKMKDFIAWHMYDNAVKVGPYHGENTRYISTEQLVTAFAASYVGMKRFAADIDYSLLGNKDGMTRKGSNCWTGDHKDVQVAAVANPPAEWSILKRTFHYWTTPYATEKIDRPSQGKHLNKEGFSKSPFKGGMDLVADLFMSALKPEAKAAFKARLAARTEWNKEHGREGWGGPTGEYRQQCADTREARGITMARTSGIRVGIYHSMTQTVDALGARLIRDSLMMGSSLEDIFQMVSGLIRTECVDFNKVRELLAKKAELEQTISAGKDFVAFATAVGKAKKDVESIDKSLNGAFADEESFVKLLGPKTRYEFEVALAEAPRAAASA